MSIQFRGSELLEMALGIEINGAAFYQTLADKTQNSDAKAIYNYLAVQERKHIDAFQGMYLKSLVDNSVFTNVAEAQQKAEAISSEIEAIDTGIQAEKDSILLYMEMHGFVRQPDQNIVLDIIGEEKTHLRQLSQLKQTLQKTR